ncbi:hypothetical protein [Methylotenera sp.]|uniref:hypothetical protein n=1 Tax=Methylotenera sp. TaxID=2051956 RepID=UPI00271D902A|nr:hypothetical protein [Methylotenera sp.]MDO9206162.1 hypothetical protein [Methylotenera sp.]
MKNTTNGKSTNMNVDVTLNFESLNSFGKSEEFFDLNSDKSVLTFYSVKFQNEQRLSYEEVWQKCAVAKAENVSCTNVFRFQLKPTELSKMLRNLKLKDNNLLSDIKCEHQNGAVFMFVQPIVGAPIDGFYIEDFIAQVGI